MGRRLFSGARAALVLGVMLLLVLSSQQVLAMHTGGRTVARRELQMPSAPKTAPSGWFLLLRRAARSTPLWRTMGSKPLGAFCKRGLECSTHTCRNGHCADPRIQS